MKETLLAVTGLLCAAASAQAQQLSTQELDDRLVHRRAFEAVVWGMPAVNYELMVQEMRKVGGDFNQIVWWPGLLDWKSQTLTPNPDVIYLMPFFDTKDVGPVVPTDAKGRFEVMGRFYGPDKALFDKSWKLDDIEKLK